MDKRQRRFQTLPAYCGVQEVYSSSNWVYIRSTGLGSFVMGPWYLNAQHSKAFPNWPVNQKTMYRHSAQPGVADDKNFDRRSADRLFCGRPGDVQTVGRLQFTAPFQKRGRAEHTGYWNRDAYVKRRRRASTRTTPSGQRPISLPRQTPARCATACDHIDFNTG